MKKKMSKKLIVCLLALAGSVSVFGQEIVPSGYAELDSWTKNCLANRPNDLANEISTTVQQVSSAEKQTSADIYDLQGRKVNASEKGQVYIVGGKKVTF